MGRSSPALVSFNAGEWSPRMEGRVDIAKYGNACKILENFVPLVQGGARKRSGTQFVAEIPNSAKPAILIPFEFSVEQAYQLEFGDFTMRVYMDGGQVLSGGVPYSLATPYPASEVSRLQWAQSADVLYLAHPNYPPQKVSRTDHDAWTITPISWKVMPFGDENVDEAKRIWISASTGSGLTLTSNANIFTADDVGRFIRLREIVEANNRMWEANVTSFSAGDQCHSDGKVYRKVSGAGTGVQPPTHDILGERKAPNDTGTAIWELDHYGFGVVEITAFSSATQVTVTVVQRVPETYVGTADNDPGAYTHYERFRWSFSAFDEINGYPTTVTFFEDRLWWAGTRNNPQTIWGSKTGDYESHRVQGNDLSAVSFTLNTDSVNAITWLSAREILVIGTTGGVFPAPAISTDEAISPTNPIKIVRQAPGARTGVRPSRADGSLLFVHRSGKTLSELLFDFSSDEYKGVDLTIFSDHIVEPKISAMAYQAEESLLWVCMEDGTLACLTFERDQDVVGWHRHPIGGDAMIESVSVISTPDGDQLWMICKRTINGATKRYVEYMQPFWTSGQIEDAFFVDSGLSYSGAPTTTISGLSHLEGEIVNILVDGAAHPQRTVSGGQISLAVSGSDVHVGLPFDATLQTMRIEAGSSDGTAQGKMKRIPDMVVRLDQTGSGLYFGMQNDLTKMDPVIFRDSYNPGGFPVPLYDGDTEVLSIPGGYERDSRITLKHALPLPCTIVGIFPHVSTERR